MTYLWLNLIFGVAAIAVGLLFARGSSTRSIVVTGLALLAITAIGDSLIVWSGIVAYDPAKILGIMIGFAPVEDFAYAIVAIVLVPVIWNASAKRK